MKSFFSLNRLFVLLVLGLSAGTALARNAYLSDHTINLTSEAPGTPAFDEQGAEMVAVSNTVHLVWVNRSSDPDFAKLFYMRSVDGGRTFEPKRELLSLNRWTKLSDDNDMQRLAVDGGSVHVAVGVSGDSICYFRSTDNGQTFEEPRYFGDLVELSDVRVAADQAQITIAWGRIYRESFMGGFLGVRPWTVSSSDGGHTFSGPALASQFENGYEGSPRDLLCVSNYVYLLVYDRILQLGVSTNAGANFSLRTISTPSSNGKHYADSLHDDYYAPNLAAAGDRIHIAWTGWDDRDVESVFYLQSTNRGLTLNAPLNLTSGVVGSDRTPVPDHIGIAAQSNYAL